MARGGLVPLAGALAVGLVWLWWPNGEYEPLRRGEKWTVQDTFEELRNVPSGRPGLTAEREQKLEDESSTPTTTPSTSTTTVADDETDDTRRTATTTRSTRPAEGTPTTTNGPTPTTTPADTTEETTP